MVVGRTAWQNPARSVNATCVNDRLRAAILGHNPSCWSELAPSVRHNVSSDPWISCMLATVSGIEFNGARPGPAGPMSSKQITSAFERGFDPPAHGGCPELQDGHATEKSAGGRQFGSIALLLKHLGGSA